MINTTEQLGGALGIALLSAVMLDVYRNEFFDALARRGINVTEDEIEQGKEFILKANEQGRNATEAEGTTKAVLGDIIQYHALGYEVMFFASAGIALLGALVCFVLVRKTDRVEAGPIFSRRSRWLYTSSGRSAAITKRPPTESESES
jgi:hypothetical protein